MKNQKQKNNKGITLVALIITIIVLLILAAVAISAVQDGGIVDKAKQARDNYAQAQTTENELLSAYLNEIEAHSQGSKPESTKKKIYFTVKNRDYHYAEKQFEAEEGMSWGEWINSAYNTDGFVYYDEGNNYILIYSSYYGYVLEGYGVLEREIIAGYVYESNVF